MSENLEDDILREFQNRAPNPIHADLLHYIFQTEIPKDKIIVALEKLLNENKIGYFGIGNLRPKQSNPNYITYSLPVANYISIPIKPYFKFGSHKVPRILSNSPISSEQINIITEFLAKYTEELTKEIEEKYENSVKQYWVNLITVFGLFLAVFALITASSQKITIDGGKNFWDIVGLNVAQVLPLALVLFGFIFLLNYILNNNFRSSKSKVK